MEISELINQAAKGESRAKLAAKIGISRQTLHSFEEGVTCPPWVVARLAEEAGVDPVAVTFLHLKDTAKKPHERALWERLLSQTARALTIAGLAVLLSFGSVEPAYSSDGMEPESLYIMGA